MQLNNEATDEERQHLLPFVTRPACTNTTEVEREVHLATRLRFRQSFQCCRVRILEAALVIGGQADGLVPGAVRIRMAAVQQSAAIPTSVADHPMFAKIKS